MKIPADFPVQPLKATDATKYRVTCGTCGLSWDDQITPTPSGRCPFEYFHGEIVYGDCPSCNGDGVIFSDRLSTICGTCNGTGQIRLE